MPLDDNIKNFNGQTITASEYYYGCLASTWDDMKYWEAIEDRNNRASALFKKLYQEVIDAGYLTPLSDEKQIRIKKVRTASQDTKQLLDERTLVL